MTRQWNSTLHRHTPLRRKSRLRPIGRRGRRQRREGRVFGGLCDYVRDLPCCACGAPPPSDPHHVRSRGAGYEDWLACGAGNVVPLCRSCHREVEAGRDAFEVAHRIDLAVEARALGESYVNRSTEE